MFQKILVPTDFSSYSQNVLECITELPSQRDVVLLHIVRNSALSRSWDPASEVEKANEMIEKQKLYLQSLRFNVKTRVETLMDGDTAKIVQKVADEENATLIVMGARGKGRVSGLLLGSVSKNVLLYGKTNLLLMRYKVLEGETLGRFCRTLFTRVICPTDFSQPARDAISFISTLNGVEEIELQHVVASGESEKEIDTAVSDAGVKLNEIVKEIERPGLKVSVHVQVGSAPEEISRLADKEDASLIAMSSHGKGWLDQITAGSTTYETARVSNRPILVVRTEKKA